MVLGSIAPDSYGLQTELEICALCLLTLGLSIPTHSNLKPAKVLKEQAIRDQEEFGSSSGLEKCLSNGCSAVNGCRQNESLIKHHNNPHHSSPSVNIWRRQKLRVCNKSGESIIHNNASSSDKVFWSESGEKSAAFTRQNSSKLICDHGAQKQS